jgi:hypothetical protein
MEQQQPVAFFDQRQKSENEANIGLFEAGVWVE